MYKSVFICYIIICSVLCSYEFQGFKISGIGSYRQDEINLSYRDERIFDPNAIREFLDTFHVYQTGGSAELLLPFAVFLRSSVLYGFGYTHKAFSQMRVAVQDISNTVVARFMHDFRYKAKAYITDVNGSVGYPVKFGPFIFMAFFGYGYDKQNIKRENIDFSYFSNSSSTASFKPSNHLGNKFYAPFFGLELRITPIAKGRLVLISEYEFHWGIFQSSSSYLINTQTTTVTQNAKQNILIKKKGFSNKFFLQALIGLTSRMLLGFKLKYSYLQAKKGQSNQVIFGTQNNVQFHQGIQRTFNGLKAQYLGGEVELSFQF